ncbi:caffeoylshikimate esterase-like [Impatiens glandulifera]|uniref:caffeoylshikimate esterase-like n=1 Tax=Impatiens glandulifera TaxID=253017 RepID=UPI001FB0A554|nr:caffeoylshikimate esterase-like [Impatiens glandulifera]
MANNNKFEDEEGIKYEEEFVLNSRGMKLFTCRWVPTTTSNTESKGLIFLCHGYGMDTSVSMKGTGKRLAKAGYEVHGMDYEGHGKSSGLQGYIPSFDALVNDCSRHYKSIADRKENLKKMRILLGESMGGAVELLLHRIMPNFWDAAVLVAPMCKIADDMKPNPFVIKVLTILCNIIPTWKITPIPDIIDIAFRNPEIRKEVRSNPNCYKGRPRLLTGNQLLNVSLDLEKRLNEVSLPFLVVHGDADKVTDPAISKLLYESASSTDKTFKLYPGMWHDLIYGELPENIDIVFSDVIAWLDDRVVAENERMEREQKLANDEVYIK